MNKLSHPNILRWVLYKSFIIYLCIPRDTVRHAIHTCICIRWVDGVVIRCNKSQPNRSLRKTHATRRQKVWQLLRVREQPRLINKLHGNKQWENCCLLARKENSIKIYPWNLITRNVWFMSRRVFDIWKFITRHPSVTHGYRLFFISLFLLRLPCWQRIYIYRWTRFEDKKWNVWQSWRKNRYDNLVTHKLFWISGILKFSLWIRNEIRR